MNEKIYSITIVTQQGTHSYHADENTDIIEVSNKYPDPTESIFEVTKHGKLIAKIINCPVDIQYTEE